MEVDLRDPAVLAWMGEHLTELRRSAYGQRLLYQSLAAGFVVGLAAMSAATFSDRRHRRSH